MATTLTDELTRVSVADIEKWEEDGDTLYVYGRCTTPEIDTDDQVVDSSWSGPALKEYMAVAPTVRVQHNAQRDPAGSAVRVDVNRDGDGSHWLKAAVDEPVAARLVKRGHLRAFSVGIARPVIERDISGKARGGIIKGGKIVEVSLVDSPANRSCFLEIAKSAADGTPELTGKMVGDDDVIQKALGGDLLTKDGSGGENVAKSITPAPVADISAFEMPDLNITFTPNDMARMLKQKVVQEHYDELARQATATDPALKAVMDAEVGVYKRDIDTATRRRLASEGNALPNLSYPIENEGDLGNAATLARSGHGDVGAARRLIARRAKELGVANPLDDDDKVKKSSSEEEAVAAAAEKQAQQAEYFPREVVPGSPMAESVKEAEPDVTKEPACSGCGDSGKVDGKPCPSCCAEKAEKDKPVKKAKKKKQLPPWLNKPTDSGSDDEKESSGDTGSCKMDHAHTEKCKTTPAEAAGLSGTHDMTAAPVPELLESPPMASTKGATPQSAGGVKDSPAMNPVPAHREPDGALTDVFEADAGMSDGDSEAPTRLEAPMKGAQPEVAALLRFQALGVDPDLGRLHDMTCPAYHPDEVAKYHPYADFTSLIEEGAWQRKALRAAAGPVEAALDMHAVWQAALVLKQADPGVVNDFRLAAFKAFRDANPGPATYPTPGSMSPQRYNRPLITDGHESSSAGHDGPNSSPQVATSAPSASSFDRPPLSAGHQTPSPSFMKGGGEYPQVHGIPVQLSYARDQREQAKYALEQMHTHLASVFPTVCPMDLNQPLGDGHGAGTRHPVPVPAGVGKSIDPEPAPEAAPDGVFKAPVEDGDAFSDVDIAKGRKKLMKKLGKKVMQRKLTVDEATALMGNRMSRKAREAAVRDRLEKGLISREEALRALGFETEVQNLAKSMGLDETKVIVLPPAQKADGPAPVAASFGPADLEAAVTKAVSPLLEKIQQQDQTLSEEKAARAGLEASLAENKRVLDAIADQPDPSTAAFSGLAFKSVQARRPAGVLTVAEAAARSQDMIRRGLENDYRNHSNPAVREKAAEALAQLGVEATSMT